MRSIRRFLSPIFGLFLVLSLCRCGVVEYPGQPGVVTNNFSKIDIEYLEEPGLFVYETVYDNRTDGKGVGAIVTKLYPTAKTFTSNARTNADGTVYRGKTQYNGAEVQMIALPSAGQVHLSPNHKLMLMIGHEVSLDEVDDKNTAEENIFKAATSFLTPRAFETKKLRWDLLRAGTLGLTGNLSYQVTSLKMGEKAFNPSLPITVETSLFQNAVRSNISAEVKAEMVQFLETHYPKGYQGIVNVQVKGQADPVPLKLKVHTPRTLEASGIRVLKDASMELWDEIVRNFRKSNL